MHVPLMIDEAFYQDLMVRENNSYMILFEFLDSLDAFLDLADYKIRLVCFTKGKQTTPTIEFSSDLGDFINTGTGSFIWNVEGSRTQDKQGSYIYHADLIHTITNKEATFMYGMFTVINKNG